MHLKDQELEVKRLVLKQQTAPPIEVKWLVPIHAPKVLCLQV